MEQLCFVAVGATTISAASTSAWIARGVCSQAAQKATRTLSEASKVSFSVSELRSSGSAFIGANFFRCTKTVVPSATTFGTRTIVCTASEASATQESLQEQLKSDSLTDRIQAVRQCRQLEPVQALEVLLSALQDLDMSVRFQAIQQLAFFDPIPTPPRAVSIITELLFHDPEVSIQAAAADVVAGLRIEAAYEALERRLLESKDWVVQVSILAALGELRTPRAYDLLTEGAKGALGSEDLLRLTSVMGLGELGDKRAVSLLEAMKDDATPGLQERVTMALEALQ